MLFVEHKWNPDTCIAEVLTHGNFPPQVVTSMDKELGQAVDIPQVSDQMVHAFVDQIKYTSVDEVAENKIIP